uniref:Elongation of very long chain fatty acids protein n=1 Tax=Panagrellus redivivus TaxID=6233 RepID=A0A7E4W8F9_PANRE
MASSLYRLIAIGAASPFSYEDGTAFTAEHQSHIIGISIAYVVAIFAIQRFMKHRQAFELKGALQAWNLGLAVFSLWGAIVTGSQIWFEVKTRGLVASYCTRGGFYKGYCGFWTYLFCYSKVVELGDTFFIVLRKKPLIFLHWYHHIATLNYAVLTYIDGTAYNSYIVFLNFAVHSVMYSYYFLNASGIRLGRHIARCITCLQLTQFFVTTVLLIHMGFLMITGGAKDCEVTITSYLYCVLMEISYIYLFGQFFKKNYTAKSDVSNVRRKFE